MPARPGDWQKLGLVFNVAGQGGWMNSHAQVPTAMVLEDRIRVFISSRPTPGRSELGYVDLDRDDPTRVMGFSERPILPPGGPGTFDEHGVMPSSVVPSSVVPSRVMPSSVMPSSVVPSSASGVSASGGRIRLYYSGWSRLGGAAPYHNTTGLAVSDDGGLSFRREVEGPVLDRAPREPFSATSPCVLLVDGLWHVFYSAGLGWIEIDGTLEHVYDLRHATSTDGIDWTRLGRPAIAQAFPEEAITRPSIIRAPDGSWLMWYCHRGSAAFRSDGDAYRIGFATSTDLVEWVRRDDESGMTVSGDGWDSRMIAYPCVIEDKGRLIMLYNGDAFGAAGFGLAIRHV